MNRKFNTVLLVLSYLFGAFLIPQAQAELIQEDLIINNVTVISAERKEPLYNAFVHIKGQRIVEISTTPIQLEGKVQSIDASQQFLIPGLMDSHVHLTFMPGIQFGEHGPLESLQNLQEIYEKQQPRSYLYHGFTQLLDPALHPQLLNSFNSQALKPDVFFCGATPILGGYPTVFSTSDALSMEIFPYFVDQEIPGRSVPGNIDMSVHSPEALIRKMKQDGAICNKIHIENGFGDQFNWPMISKENITKLRTSAHKNGLKVIAHANAYDMQKIAVDMDVDIIAHGMWNWTGATDQGHLPKEIKRLLDKIIAKKIAFQATSGVMVGLRDTTAGISIENKAYVNVTPREILDYYKSESGRWFQRELRKDFGDLSDERIFAIHNSTIEQGDRVIQYLADNGGLLLLASDTPASPVYVSQPGLNSYLEMEHMVSAGVSLSTLFKSATINNARAFNIDKDYGTIEPGKIANLLLLKSNPLKSVKAYNQINHIILAGKVIARDSLLANE